MSELRWYRTRPGLRWHVALPAGHPECRYATAAMVAGHAPCLTHHLWSSEICRTCRRLADRYLGDLYSEARRAVGPPYHPVGAPGQ